MLATLLLAKSKWQKSFPGGSVVKNMPVDAGAAGSIPGLGRAPREGSGTPVQYSCLGNPTDRETWKATKATVHGVPEELDTT